MKKFIFASDLHGDMAEPEAVSKLLDFCEIWKPEVRVFGGDLFDFRNIRRGAGAGEKADSMQADVEAGLMFLNNFKDFYLLFFKQFYFNNKTTIVYFKSTTIKLLFIIIKLFKYYK